MKVDEYTLADLEKAQNTSNTFSEVKRLVAEIYEKAQLDMAREVVVPEIAKVFKEYPEAKSVGVLISSEYDDEGTYDKSVTLLAYGEVINFDREIWRDIEGGLVLNSRKTPGCRDYASVYYDPPQELNFEASVTEMIVSPMDDQIYEFLAIATVDDGKLRVVYSE